MNNALPYLVALGIIGNLILGLLQLRRAKEIHVLVNSKMTEALEDIALLTKEKEVLISDAAKASNILKP